MEPRVSPDLRRNQDDTWLFGVASGLADYFGVDATVVRVIFIVTAVLSFGSTLLIYLLLAILIPEREKDSKTTDSNASLEKYRFRTSEDKLLVSRRRQLAGWVVISLGALLLAANLGWFQWFSFGRFWPILLIALGIALLAGVFGSGSSRSKT